LNLFNKKIKLKGLVAGGLTTFLFSIPFCANGAEELGATASLLFQPILQITKWFLILSKYVLTAILVLSGKLLDLSLNIGGISTASIVREGAGIVRDVTNLLFIVAIIIVAFALILRIEPYASKAKEIIPKMIIAALLINFSVVLVTPIIDFSQVITQSFVSAVPGNFSDMISFGGKIYSLWQPNDAWYTKALSAIVATFDQVLNLFMANAVLLVLIFTIIAGAIFMIIRVIYLWILLIFSPITWLLWALPSTKQYWDKWWSEFMSWTFFAPIYTFMLYLVIRLIQLDVIGTELQIGANTTGLDASTTVFFANPTIIFQYVAIVGMSIASLFIAKKTGVYGADGALKLGKSMYTGGKGMADRWLAKGTPTPLDKFKTSNLLNKGAGVLSDKGWGKTAKGVSFAGRAIDRSPMLLSPTAWSRAWAETKKKSNSTSFGTAQGTIEDIFSNLQHPVAFARGKGTHFATYRQQQAIANRKDELAKELNKEEQIVQAARSSDKKDLEPLLLLAAEKNSLNAFFGALVGKGEIAEYTPKEVSKYLTKNFGNRSGEIATSMASLAMSAGSYNLTGISKWDEQTGSYAIQENDDKRLLTIKNKMSELEPQKFATIAHPDTFFGYETEITKDSAGNDIKKMKPSGQLSDSGKVFLGKILTGTHNDQVGRLQMRTLRTLYQNKNKLTEYATTIETTDQTQAKIINGFITKIVDRYEGNPTKK